MPYTPEYCASQADHFNKLAEKSADDNERKTNLEKRAYWLSQEREALDRLKPAKVKV